MDYRVCTKCNVEKPIGEFHKDSRSSGGRRAQCKECRSAHMKGFYASKADEVKERMREYREANPDRVRESERKRYAKHRDKRIALAVDAVHARRARMFSGEFDKGITAKRLRERDGGECCYCGVSLDFERKQMGQGVGNGATIEHIIPISRGGAHVWENVTLACRDCNFQKGSRSLDEWRGGVLA